MKIYLDETGQQHELKLKLSYRRTSIWAYCECGFDAGYMNDAELGLAGIQNNKNQARADHDEFFQAGA
jgi:hypothetical protein